MWLMLQHDKCDDYVLATNEFHSVREFVEKSFQCVGIQLKWRGSGIDEVGYDNETGNVYVTVSDKYYVLPKLKNFKTLQKQKRTWLGSVCFI